MADDIARLGFEIDASPLQRAGQAAAAAANQFQQAGNAAQNAQQNMTGVGRAAPQAAQGLGQIGSAAQAAAQGVAAVTSALNVGGSAAGAGLAGALGQVSTATAGLLARFGALGASAAGVVTGIGALGVAFVGLQAGLSSFQDKYAQFEARLKNTLGSTLAARDAMDALSKSAQQTGISFQSGLESFARLARNAEDLGASNREILRLSETIQKLGVISGASQGEIGSGMLQLAQALAAGRLNGDELRSIMENMPALAKAIADGLGVGVGQLRAMGAAGELTGSKVFQALLSQTDKVNKEFGSLPDTTERAFQRVSDNFSKLLGNLGERLNSSQFIQVLLRAADGTLKLANQLVAADKNPEAAELAGLRTRRERILQRGAGVENERQLASVDARIAALESRVAQTQREEDKARVDESERAARAIAARGRQFISEALQDTPSSKATQIGDQMFAIGSARIAATSGAITGEAGEAARMGLRKMDEALVKLRAELENAADATTKFRRSTSDYREAVAIGGTGGGISLVQQAQDLARQSRLQGVNVSTRDALRAVVSDRALRVGEDVAAMQRRTQDTRAQIGAVGATRDALRELEVAQEAAAFEVQTFGKLADGEARIAVERYTAALRENKKAQDDLANARALQGMRDALAVTRAGNAALEDGEYAVRRIEMIRRAEQADRMNPGMGALQIEQFDLGEQRAAALQIQGLRRGLSETLTMTGASPAEQRRLALERRIENAQRGADPRAREEIAFLMQAQDAADLDKSLVEQTRQITLQTQQAKERASLVRYTGQQAEIENALLQKRFELQQQGVSLEDERAQVILRATEELAKQNFVLRQQQDQADSFNRIWTTAAQDVQRAISGAFETAFTQGGSIGQRVLNGLSQAITRVSASLVSAVVFDPLQSWAKSLGPLLMNAILPGAGVGAAGTAAATAMVPNPMGGFTPALGYGGIVNAAAGILLDRPTVVGTAYGRTAVGGEAGPEAVLPLKRGADGRLGVSSGAGGGAVQVQIYDQRSNANAEQVQVEERRGPDGMRFVQVMIRDEMRRALRSGEFDRDFSGAYGTSRRLVSR